MSAKPRTLSNRIEAIEYVHADDGMPYRHDFTRTGSTIRLQKDGSVVIRNKDHRKLWNMFTVDGKQQPFLINPSGSKHMATKRSRSTRRRTPAATKRRRRKALATSTRKSTMANPKKRRRRRNVYAGAVNPPKRRRRRNAYANPPGRRRRHHRRNPPFSVTGIVGRVTGGLVDGALVVAGKTIARLVSAQLPYQDGSMMDSLVEVGAATALAMFAPRVLGTDRARFLAAGAYASPLETLAAQAKIPYVSSMLGKVGKVGADTSVVYPAADVIPTTGRVGRVGAYAPNGGRLTSPRMGAYAPQPQQPVSVFQNPS